MWLINIPCSKVGHGVKIDGYYFDETALSQSQKSELDAIAGVLTQYSDIKTLIVGHTCEIGYKNINLKKGLKRAEAAKEYLIQRGISPERISVDSDGETQPTVQNLSEENRKKNRRIEFRIE
jgi:outer membrane protein OmpA-like peptidoglycan-associated protein